MGRGKGCAAVQPGQEGLPDSWLTVWGDGGRARSAVAWKKYGHLEFAKPPANLRNVGVSGVAEV